MARLIGYCWLSWCSSSNLEDPQLSNDEDLGNNTDLFLQEINIIPDYLKDLRLGRQDDPQNSNRRGQMLRNYGFLYLLNHYSCIENSKKPENFTKDKVLKDLLLVKYSFIFLWAEADLMVKY